MIRLLVTAKVARELGLDRDQKEAFRDAWREAERALAFLPRDTPAAEKAQAVQPALDGFLAVLDDDQRRRAAPLIAQARARWGAEDPAPEPEAGPAEGEDPRGEEGADIGGPSAAEMDLEAEAMAFAEGASVSILGRLESAGIAVPDPDDLDDAELPARLRDLIARLADHRVYLTRTDHLTDRGLFEFLVDDGLRTEQPEARFGEESEFWITCLHTDSHEGLYLYLAFYASEADRLNARRRGMALPDRREPIVDRDRHLPRPPGAEAPPA